MRFAAVATDYDGTLATDGHVPDHVVDALERVRASGRRLLLVTGRELDDLRATFDRLDLFEAVVAENGAVLYLPGTRQERVLADPPPEAFHQALVDRSVSPLSVGRVVVATREPHHRAVLDAVRDLGLELSVIFNKGAVMALPAAVTKASGLAHALEALRVSFHNVVAIGDGENDHVLLGAAECGVAVANAVPSLAEQADWVTSGAGGDGVVELVGALLDDDLAFLSPRLARHRVRLGATDEGSELAVAPFDRPLLVAGASGSGKSTFNTGLLERVAEQGYQYCIVDPEGDYEELPGAVVLGAPDREPLPEEVMSVLEDPRRSVVVNLLGVALEHRPAFAQSLLAHLIELRARAGRPHWIVVDEAHHVFPAGLDHPPVVPAERVGLVLITVHPASVEASLLGSVSAAVTVGREAAATLAQLPEVELPDDVHPVGSGEALHWRRVEPAAVQHFTYDPPTTERRRHSRKYATGELPEDLSFYFRGPEGRLNLRAQNLALFLQVADGVDDETWEFHLRRGDVERWFAEVIKDDDLAAEARRAAALDTEASRAAVRDAVDARYTAPAT